MSNVSKYRTILPRTQSCYSLEGIQAQSQVNNGNLPPKQYDERRSHESYHVVQMEEGTSMGHSGGGSPRKRRPTSPLSIVVCPDVRDEGSTLLRLHWTEAWGCEGMQVPGEVCYLCDKRWELHSTWNRSEGNPTKKYKAIFAGGKLSSVWEESSDSPRHRSRLLPQQQEEDRGILYMDPKEEQEIRAYLEGDTEYSDDWITKQYGEDLSVAQQEHVKAEDIRREGFIHPWSNNDGEDEFENFLGEIFPYIPDPIN